MYLKLNPHYVLCFKILRQKPVRRYTGSGRNEVETSELKCELGLSKKEGIGGVELVEQISKIIRL